MEEENEKLEEETKVPGNLEIDPLENQDLTTKASKSLLKLLFLKTPIGWIFLGVMGIIFIVMLPVLDSANVYSKEYKEPTCTNVTITYKPYGNENGRTTRMSLEDYVENAVYTYTKDFQADGSLYQIYFSLSVALRNEVLTHNCAVTVRDQNIETATSVDDDFTRAIRDSKGVIITDRGKNLIRTNVNHFCWQTKTSEAYHLTSSNLEVSTSFTNQYLHNSIYQDCECNQYTGVMDGNDTEGYPDYCWAMWTDDENHPYKEWTHQETSSGFSVYGAYYLLRTFGYDYDAILRYFYGQSQNDFMYLTTLKNEEETKTFAFQNGNLSSFCSTSNSEANLMTFVKGWELDSSYDGNPDYYCGQNNDGYVASGRLGDGTITVGPGFTNYAISSPEMTEVINQNDFGKYFTYNASENLYSVEEGQCVPISVVETLRLYTLEEGYFARTVDAALDKYQVSVTSYQRDALLDLAYGRPQYVDDVVKAYSEGGLEKMWSVLKDIVSGTIGGITANYEGYYKRRKAEFALFVTGDYTDQGKFYSRGLEDYDNYNSEHVLERMAQCSMNGSTDFIVPLPSNSGYSCTSPFGLRSRPTAGASTSHQGLDLGVSGGTDILAAKSGMVIETLNNVSGSSPSTGNYVKIQHDDGTKTAYYHMQMGSVVVQVGDHVEQGQKIGAVGSTGVSTGNHLHFAIFDVTGAAQDPYDYLDLSSLQDTSRCHSSF